MSDAIQFDFGPLSIAVLSSRRGKTELAVSAFDQLLGSFSTRLPAADVDLDTLLGSETEQQALFDIFREHCAPLLRARALHGPASTQALCIRLVHPCNNPQCDVMHELLCMHSAQALLTQATPASIETGTAFTLVDEQDQPLAATQYLGEADTESLLVQHVAPALVEMAGFFTPACMQTELSRWEPPTPADMDIISYFGFFSGSPDPIYGVFQYINPLLLSIWMERVSACIGSTEHNRRAQAQQAWFKLLARLHILPETHLATASTQAGPGLAMFTPGSGSRRLH